MPVSFWRKVGQLAIQWIREDAKSGKMQTTDGNSRKPYYSRQYAKYKANDMRKLDGKRLSSGYATSITSNQTSYVDMTLTGRMFRGLHVVPGSATSTGVTLGYRSEDAGKVIGNRDKYGRDVANLNKENREKVKQMIVQQFDENIRKTLKDITINVRF